MLRAAGVELITDSDFEQKRAGIVCAIADMLHLAASLGIGSRLAVRLAMRKFDTEAAEHGAAISSSPWFVDIPPSTLRLSRTAEDQVMLGIALFLTHGAKHATLERSDGLVRFESAAEGAVTIYEDCSFHWTPVLLEEEPAVIDIEPLAEAYQSIRDQCIHAGGLGHGMIDHDASR